MRTKRHHRGRRTRQKGATLNNVILIIAVLVFLVSAIMLFRIVKGYLDGRSEYSDVRDVAIEEDNGFWVDFDALLEINQDTVGWIRFYPEPSQISYPVVQGQDNDFYLHNTFSSNENTLGAIFVNANNRGDFSDRNTIVYGHRMRDGSMFRHLEDYEDQSFWEENPYFYIYTLDGKEVTYEIYSAGVVKDTSDTYQTVFTTEEDYQEFLDLTKEVSAYDTGVSVTTADTIVTLSTCTAASNEDRFVVRGVKIQETEMGRGGADHG